MMIETSSMELTNGGTDGDASWKQIRHKPTNALARYDFIQKAKKNTIVNYETTFPTTAKSYIQTTRILLRTIHSIILVHYNEKNSKT